MNMDDWLTLVGRAAISGTAALLRLAWRLW